MCVYVIEWAVVYDCVLVCSTEWKSRFVRHRCSGWSE